MDWTSAGRWMVLGAVLLGASACKRDGKAQAAAEGDAPAPVVLGAENIVVADSVVLASGPIISGTLSAVREAQIRAEVAGVVREVRVAEGERVTRGATLARIDDTTLRDAFFSAQAAVRSAETALRDAQRNLERDERLTAAGATAERDLERSRLNVASAEAALADARARLASAQERLEKASVRAPFAGVVSDRPVSAGDVVQPGTELFRLVDPTRMELEATVPVEYLRTLRVGTPVDFQIAGLERRFTGKIDRINPAVDPATRQVRIYLTIPNPEGELVAGLFAEGRVATESKTAVAAPFAAVREGTTTSVLRVRDARVERVPVELGMRDEVAERVEIRSAVAKGDTLLLGSAQDIVPGTVVRIRQERETGRAGES